jgi:chromosome segregation ATPase
MLNVANLDPAWIALIGTLCGGVGLKVLEHWLGKSQIKIDEAAKLRDELRIQLTQQGERIKALEDEVDEWREKFYDLRDKHSELNTQYLIALEKIKAEAEAAARRADNAVDKPK